MLSLIGAYIAWRQWQTAHYRVKLDLFDRRYAIFLTARDFIRHLNSRDDTTDEELKKLQSASTAATFLFGQSVADRLADIEDIASEWQGVKLQRAQATKEQDAKWLHDLEGESRRLEARAAEANKSLVGLFQSFLTLDRIR